MDIEKETEECGIVALMKIKKVKRQSNEKRNGNKKKETEECGILALMKIKNVKRQSNEKRNENNKGS